MKEPKPEIIKTTIRVPKPIWQRVQHFAIDSDVTAERVVVEALKAYLRAKGGD
jgi:predicted transcriptional regulator